MVYSVSFLSHDSLIRHVVREHHGNRTSQYGLPLCEVSFNVYSQTILCINHNYTFHFQLSQQPFSPSFRDLLPWEKPALNQYSLSLIITPYKPLIRYLSATISWCRNHRFPTTLIPTSSTLPIGHSVDDRPMSSTRYMIMSRNVFSSIPPRALVNMSAKLLFVWTFR